MAGIKTRFLPGYDLFFTLRTQHGLYVTYNVLSQREFMSKVLSQKAGRNGPGLSPEDYYNIFRYALLHEHKEITLEEVADLIDRWQLEGTRDQDDLDLLMYETFANSGMYPRDAFEALKKLKEGDPAKMEEYLKKVEEMQGADKGEVKS
jgi:hypothetical protein